MSEFNIVYKPNLLSPSYNEMYIVLDSDLKTKDNFRFISKVNVNGQLLDSIVTPVNPNGLGELDIQRVTKQFIKEDFNPTRLEPTNIPNSFATYSIDFELKFFDEWRFQDNFIWQGDAAFFHETDEPFFEIGDYVYITQDNGYAHVEYNGVTRVTDVGYTASGVFGTSGYYVGTSLAWEGSSPINAGTMSLNNNELSTITATSSIGTQYAFNGRFDWDVYMDVNSNEYISSTSSVGKFMTDLPDNYNIEEGSHMFINVFATQSEPLKYLYIESSNGVFRIENNNSNANNDSNKLIQLPLGEESINNATYSVISGSLPVLDNTTATFSFWMEDDSSNKSTEVKTLKYNQNNCTSYDTYELIFMDKLGSYIPFNFTLRDTRVLNVDKKKYTKNYGGYDSNLGRYNYNSFDRGDKGLGSTHNKTYTLRSDYIDEETSNFLEEIIYSNDVYIRLPENDKIIPVIVDTNTYNLERRKNGLIRFDINVKPSFKNYTQD